MYRKSRICKNQKRDRSARERERGRVLFYLHKLLKLTLPVLHDKQEHAEVKEKNSNGTPPHDKCRGMHHHKRYVCTNTVPPRKRKTICKNATTKADRTKGKKAANLISLVQKPPKSQYIHPVQQKKKNKMPPSFPIAIDPPPQKKKKKRTSIATCPI